MSDQDHQKQRCRRLGHEVDFAYCCRESDGKPCRLILNCWFERFDVREYLRENLTEEEMAEVEKAHGAPPPNKTANLLTLIEQARQRLGKKDPS